MSKEDVPTTDTINSESGDETLHLELNIIDPIVIKYLSSFDEPMREEKAIEALRVGVIAIRSASPSLDTKVVEDKFREVENSIDVQLTEFTDDLKKELDDHFEPEKGTLSLSLGSIFGDGGQLGHIFKQYFGSEGGKVSQLLMEHIGPSSDFAKSIDPKNKESVISLIEESVKKHLEDKVKEIINEFSLDVDDSAITRLKNSISKEVQTIQKTNENFFADLKEALGIKTGVAKESEKGTEKGREFETALYDRVAELGRQLGDNTENLRAIVGKIPRCKKGDYAITLGETSGAPGRVFVVEVKKEKGYKLKSAIDELKEAKENRNAVAGVFVFAKGYEPPEIGDFHFVGDDFFVTVDEDALMDNEPLLFLESAYKILRSIIVTTFRKEEVKEIDIDQIKREIDSIIELVKTLSEMTKKARTIHSNSEFIVSTATQMKEDMESRLSYIMSLLSRG